MKRTKTEKTKGLRSKVLKRSKAPANTSKSDIITLILEDHKSLKRLIKVMKNEVGTFSEKKKAFKEFISLLGRHEKPEEQTWYASKKALPVMMEEGLEGEIEHGLADQLCEEIQTTGDKSLYIAKVRVLAELVENHLIKEEKDQLPAFKKACELEERVELGKTYLALKQTYEETAAQSRKEKNVEKDLPSEEEVQQVNRPTEQTEDIVSASSARGKNKMSSTLTKIEDTYTK